MKVVIKPVYYCDFCNKRYLAKWAINKHEKHCVKNPNRKCRMCEYVRDYEEDLDKLKAIVKRHSKGNHRIGGSIYPVTDLKDCMDLEDYKKFIVEMEGVTSCPACILAAIVQSGAYCPHFKYAEMRDAMWNVYNDGMRQANYEDYSI